MTILANMTTAQKAEFLAASVGAGGSAKTDFADIDVAKSPIIPTFAYTYPDDVRAVEQTITVTHSPVGYPWTPFPSVQTPYVRGALAGALQIRRRAGIIIRSRFFLSSWSPGAATSINYKGRVDENTAWPPTGTFADNDYYRVQFQIASGSRVIGGLGTVYPGDCITRASGAWVIQSGPNGIASPSTLEQPWWNVSAAGWFDGVQYAIGDRIVQFGGVYYHRYYRGRPDKGEHFLCGEWSAASGAYPVAGTPTGANDPQAGDLWQVTAAGTLTSPALTFAVDDYLVRYYDRITNTTIWGKIPTETITTVNNNIYLHVPVNGDLARFEVRRLNKATAEYNIEMKVLVQPAQRAYVNAVVAYTDSEGRFATTALTAALGGVALNMRAYSSAGSLEVESLAQSDVLLGDGSNPSNPTLDPYAGMVSISMDGQNDELAPHKPTWQQLRLKRMQNQSDVRHLPCTAPGRATVTYNGTRMVMQYHEPMKARDPSNAMAQQELWLSQHFLDYIDTRKVMAAGVTSTLPHLHFPGMTEAQVAATYGAIPLSYYFDYSTFPWTPGALVFKGYRSATGAPTGGVANDYWIRSVADGSDPAIGVVGNIYVNVAGTWTEYSFGSGNSLVHPRTDCKGWVDWSTAVVAKLVALRWIKLPG